MTLKKYLIGMSLMTLVAWTSFVFILNIVDPSTTNSLGFILFYTSLFLSLLGSVAIIGFLIRFVGRRKELVFYAVLAAFRQASLIAIFLISLLALLAHNMLSWVNILLLLAIVIIIELMLSGLRKGRH